MWFASTFPESVLAVSTTLLDPFGGGGALVLLSPLSAWPLCTFLAPISTFYPETLCCFRGLPHPTLSILKSLLYGLD